MKNEICIVVPSRGRPVALLEAVSSILSTCARSFTDVLVIVDADDAQKTVISGPHVQTQVNERRLPMLHALNAAIMERLDDYPIFGFSADDVRYQGRCWDTIVHGLLYNHGAGVVYGDDGIQGQNLPTHPWFSAKLVKALDYAAPPCLNHFYFDNFWRDLTKPLNALHWRPDLLTPHRHYSASGLPFDEVYANSSQKYYAADTAAYREYQRTSLIVDLEKLKAILP